MVERNSRDDNKGASDAVIGTWKLTLAAVEPGNSATIDLRADLLGRTIPSVMTDECSMTFVYPDGSRSVYFVANLLCAEYTPAPRRFAEPYESSRRASHAR